MKKKLILLAIASMFLLASCGGNSENNAQNQDNAAQEQAAPAAAEEVDLSAVPGIEAVDFSQNLTLEGNDLMKYDHHLFKVKAGENVSLHFKNVGEMPKESMGHNVVILNLGTDPTQFGNEAVKATQSEYIPLTFKSSIIAHTKLLGPGEEDTIEFVLEKKGIYTFLCSFPGHYGVMQGKIVAL